MNPAVARKLIEKFDAALSVQLFVQTELIETADELDVLPTAVLFEMYKAWPPRVRMNEDKFIEFLKVTCRLDICDEDPVEDYPAVIVGVQLKKTAKPTLKAKKRNQTKPLPPWETLERAAALGNRPKAARYLHISTGRLERLCKHNPKIAELFSRH